MKFSYANLLLLFQTLAQPCIGQEQVILGPVFEQPTKLASSALVKSAASDLVNKMQDAFKHGQTPFNQTIDNGTTLSSTIASPDGTVLDFHHTPKELNVSAGSVSHVSGNSVYRIASISKLFTVYMLLLNDGRKYWDSPVGDLVPELKLPEWQDITIGALASQLGGVGRDYNNGDLSISDFPYKEAGLPDLPEDEIPKCAASADTKACSRKEFFKGFPKRDFVYQSYTTPIYSNAAFRILGYAIEAITKCSYQDTLTTTLKSLNLDRTSYDRPKKANVGVIPNTESDWFVDEGDDTPTGGIYCSSRDLAKFGLSILQHQQLSALETRRWMKPVSHTASLRFSVGAPWEIIRYQSHGRVIDAYTKSGDLQGYHSILILIPEYNVSMSILSAGDSGSGVLHMAADEAFKLLSVFGDAAKKEACDKFCGTYANHESKLVLGTDDKQGLLIRNWVSRGKDVLKAAQAYASASGTQLAPLRLYPTNEGTYRTLIEETSGLGGVLDDPVADRWFGVDGLMYGNVAIDEFVLDGKTATPKVTRQTLYKK